MGASADVPASRLPAASLVVVLAGVSAALHVGKLPPAVPALQAGLGISLVEAGFLLSVVQIAGMTLGLAVGLTADTLGLRRCMLSGLALLVITSALGAAVQPGPQALPLLLILRAFEGVGFLLAAMPGPALTRNLAPLGTEKFALGLWSAYMPLGVTLGLLAGPLFIGWAGWRGWWGLLSLLSALAGLGLVRWVPRDKHVLRSVPAPVPWAVRLCQTWGADGPRALALGFAMYSSQWVSVIGFLPTIYAQAGVSAGAMAVLTAGAAAVNIAGNIMGGRLLQAGVAPSRLLRWGFAAMALGTLAAFAQWRLGDQVWQLPAAGRYIAVCVFSLCGGMVPATLIMLSVRLAPSPAAVSTAVGLVQQASSFGQFAAPPLVAWLARQAGGWHWTWAVTGTLSLVGIAVAMRVSALLGKAQHSSFSSVDSRP
jgi:MFS family permease